MLFLKQWLWNLMGYKNQPNKSPYTNGFGFLSPSEYDRDNMPQYTLEEIIESKKLAQQIHNEKPVLGCPPWDEKLILRYVRHCGGFGMEHCCWRAIKELCALKMSYEDRFYIFGGSFDPNCKLYEWLRNRKWYQKQTRNGITYFGIFRYGHAYQLEWQRWYEATEEGQKGVVDALFQVISANPIAFLHMVDVDCASQVAQLHPCTTRVQDFW